MRTYYARSLSTQIHYICTSEKDVPAQISLMARKMLRELFITKAYFTFLRSLKLSWLATLTSRNYQRLVAKKKHQTCNCYQTVNKSTKPPIDLDEKMLHDKQIQMIDVLRLAKIIINLIIWYYGLSNSIISNRDLVFTSKSCSPRYCFWNLITICGKTFTLVYDIANFFPPDSWDYVHGFGNYIIQ